MNILKSAFNENAELLIAEETIFIKTPEQKYQHITKIEFQCIPTLEGKIFTLKNLKHRNGTILATEFQGKQSNINDLKEIEGCDQNTCPHLFMQLPFDFFSIVKINKSNSLITSGSSNMCHIRHQGKKYQQLEINRGQNLLNTEKGTIIKCKGQTYRFDIDIT